MATEKTIQEICRNLNLLSDDGDVIRVPFLVKGKLVVPPQIGKDRIEAAFNDADRETTYVKLPDAQLIREPVIDRNTMRYTSEYVYQVLPPVSGQDLIETDIDKLVRGPYALSVEDILGYLRIIGSVMASNQDMIVRVRELYRRTTELPDTYLDASFAALPYALDTKSARDMMENELAIWNRTGSELLNGWVQLPSGVFPGMTPSLAQRLGTQGSNSIKENPATTFIRAMPTRQLHIAAGNAPGIPVISAVRAILTKSAGVVKAPYGTTLPGALLSLALASALPNHPIIQNLSIVYWQGGDESIEHTLFRLNAFDRIIVWGAPEAVASVQSRTLFTKTICFNPRYGISMVGREAFSDDLQAVAFKAATDSMIYNQKACNASLIHYVEGTPEQVNSYADILSKILDQWDTLAPQFVSPFARGQLKRMQRGKYSRAHWHVNSKERDFTSGVIVASDEFDIMDHPMSRLIVVRRVDDLADTLNRLNQSVSTVGIYPEERRLHLRDSIAARGVSSVLPLGQCERMFSGMPNDGMMVLNQLIDWKTA